MDPLSITTAVVASVQVACSILSCCYSVRTEMRKIPWTLIQIIDEVRDLRNLMETVESILGKDKTSDQPGTSETLADSIKPVVATCLAELRAIESRIRPRDVETLLDSKRKALLQALTWRLKGDEAKESILGLQRCKTSLNLAISSYNSLIAQNIEHLSISLNTKIDESSGKLDELARAQLNERQSAIVDWLSPLKPAQDHILAQSSHQSGTSEWFQNGQDFQEWSKKRNSILWLTGPPGSGKTIMMSHIIELMTDQTPVDEYESVHAFVYCNFRNPDTQDLVNIMGAILGQICTQMRHFPKELENSFQKSTDQGWGQPPTVEMISKVIKALSTKRRAYLFIDGIDEVEDPKSLAEILGSLSDSSSCVNVLVSSRNDVAIQRALSDVRRVSLEHHVSEIDQDIERYVAKRLTGDQDLAWLSADVQNLVSSSLLLKSKGSFQWASCQLASLSRCRTVRDMKRSLKRLPQGLSETYANLLLRSCPTDIALVKKIMTWLAFSCVPLTLTQLWEALAIENGQNVIDDESRLRNPQDILLLGHSLIAVSPDGHVALSHLSVRDYLVSTEIRSDPKTSVFALDPGIGHRELAQDCLTYLLLSGLSSGPSNTEVEYLSRLAHFPLLQYATKYWFYHARNATVDNQLQDLTMDFFAPEARDNFMSWVQVLNADSPFKWSVYPRHATSLYYAASLGLDEAVESLLGSASLEEVNAPGSRFGGTAIHAAAIRGHISIIKKLVTAGGDAGKADFNTVTPLHSAASRCSMETIRVLLEHGAPKEAKDGMDGKTPADWARLSGHVDVARLIETFSEEAGPDKERKDRNRKGTNCKVPSDTFSDSIPHTIEVWQPGVCFFPDFYERRSGLDCSHIVGITIGEESCTFDSDFTFKRSEGLDDGSTPVW
ncbi:NACHT domain-containing protein [Fusarium sp. LHS14.1]|nr:NACHT domain-containing protein [Fusarium sp. LHS14.1]